MATKGPGNTYGGTRNGRQGKPTTHIGYSWAREFNRSTLEDHFTRHGEQMGYSTKESYEAHAVQFANAVDRKNCVSFVDGGGTTYKYNKATNTLAVITKDGYIVTFFQPKDGYEYYLNVKRSKTKK